ncbi:MAG: haloacid dehalogenase type II [Dehalococcoidia bacterium]
MTTPTFSPKYVTFDCYGTLTHFQMSRVTREVLGDRLPPEVTEAFLNTFKAYRIDEAMGDWKPYRQVISDALRRAMAWYDMEFRPEDASAIYEDIPNWGPHPDVPKGLAELAERYPLVILSNASDDQIMHNVDKLGAPFHAVITAEQARAYKPRLAAFEHMFNELGCGPEDIVHVSSSLRYDLMSANDLRITNKVYVNRGYEPSTPHYGYVEIENIEQLLALFD